MINIFILYLSVCLLKLCRDGAWVENKGALLTFHYRETPMESRPRMVEQAKKLIEAAGFKACAAHCAIEARPPVEWNKGSASIYILRTAFGLDWSERISIIYAGDDVTDEDAMKVRIFFYFCPSNNISQFIENDIHYRSVIIMRILIFLHRP